MCERESVRERVCAVLFFLYLDDFVYVHHLIHVHYLRDFALNFHFDYLCVVYVRVEETERKIRRERRREKEREKERVCARVK